RGRCRRRKDWRPSVLFLCKLLCKSLTPPTPHPRPLSPQAGRQGSYYHCASSTPARTAIRPRNMLPTRYVTPSSPAPSSSSWCASYSKVENVVYDPVKPTATRSRKSSARSQPSCCNTRRSVSTAENQPRNNDPVTLMNKVPHGKAVPQARPKATPRPQRASPPATDPADTS